MLASTIQPLDYLPSEDGTQPGAASLQPPRREYTVITVDRVPADPERQVPEHIAAHVRYEVDGGSDVRTWLPTDDVPLRRP